MPGRLKKWARQRTIQSLFFLPFPSYIFDFLLILFCSFLSGLLCDSSCLPRHHILTVDWPSWITHNINKIAKNIFLYIRPPSNMYICKFYCTSDLGYMFGQWTIQYTYPTGSIDRMMSSVVTTGVICSPDMVTMANGLNWWQDIVLIYVVCTWKFQTLLN